MKTDISYKPWIIGGIILFSVITIIARLFFLQIVETRYIESANSNAMRFVTQYPARGLIYDRKNRLMVYNEAVYDIIVVPRQLGAFDTTALCELLNVSKKNFITQLNIAKKYSRFKPSVILKQMSDIDHANFIEKSYKFSGIYTQKRTIRRYPFHNSAHLLGYVGEVTERQIQQDTYYKSGDYIGVTGLENAYEHILRGEKGREIFLVDVHNQIKGRYKDGEDDVLSTPGKNIQITIDADLQNYGEKLMQNKTGAIIAIEPSTGEILSMVSAPSFDPNVLSGRARGVNYQILQSDTLKPLFNRPLQAQYPPGSTFKTINALIGLQLRVVYPNTYYPCHGGYRAGRFFMGCHNHASPLNLVESISNSCNAYYAYVYRNILDKDKISGIRNNLMIWKDMVNSFGIGHKLGLDFPFELSGLVPDTAYYDRKNKSKYWTSLSNVSNSIGQGELLATPLQLANIACVMANRGYYIIPHFVKNIEEKETIEEKYRDKQYTKIDTSYFQYIVEGMYQAVHGTYGATARAAYVQTLDICGKTGTAQNPHGKSHSIFIAFAPKDNPKIAIAVYIENAGYGATWSAPIASLIIEKYLNTNISEDRKWVEDRILNATILNVKE